MTFYFFIALFLAFNAHGVELDIPIGATVEGSSRYGGIQPDYFVDFDSKKFVPLRNFAKELGQQNISTWQKVELLRFFIRGEVLPHGSYSDPNYLKLLEKYRSMGTSIPLSAYVTCGVGVCRENAMVMHLALKDAGIENSFVYAKAEQIYFASKTEMRTGKVEDHAFCTVEINGEAWIVDGYNENFHGFSYTQLKSPNLHRNSKLRTMPGAENNLNYFRRIVESNEFPKILKTASAGVRRPSFCGWMFSLFR